MKLRKLILSGFKSFADKTELEFDDGISCIVGPNGCGKSNIVDAVKWVLGEQSPKSLRGSEMMDVIFNGSSTRRASGGAEVTLIFDNSSGLLRPLGTDGQSPTDTVSITRRLFRSGQSEYRINKIPCRLRDIREMFMDTGNAYSLIEQGKVEGFLQASRDERRAIFDEAAGISKYKARKGEAIRKLERVAQNMLRIEDILGEVEKRLRSIKYQAGKARSYQVHSERLKELRSLYSLAQYHALWVQRTDLQKQLDASSDALAQLAARIDQLDAARSGTEVETVDLDRAGRELQSRIGSVSVRITTAQERSEMLTARVEELDEQLVATTARCEETEAKIEEIGRTVASREGELDRIDTTVSELNQQYESALEEHRSGELAVRRLETRLEDEKAGTIDLLRRTAQLHNEIHGLDIRKENLQGRRERLTGRAEQIDQSLEAILIGRAEVETKLVDVEDVLGDARGRLEATREGIENLRDREQELRRRVGEVREERSAVGARMATLREMQQKLEGVGSGVRRVLKAHRSGRLGFLRGMLGDFLRTDVEHALVVEAALGGADQQLLADRLSDVERAEDELREVLGESGGVEVLCLDRLGPLVQDFSPGDCAEVIARVIDWVQFDSWLGPAVWRLLGRTLVVRTLRDACAAAERAPAAFRFVTLTGEVLEPDGRVRIGAANRTTGVIARHSELIELENRRETLDREIGELERRCTTAHNELEHLDDVQQKLRTVIYEANTEHVECRTRLSQLAEQIEKLEREKPLVAADLQDIAAEIAAAVRAEHDAKTSASELERRSAEREAEVKRIGEQIDATRARRDELAARITELKVALVRAEEKKRSLDDSLAALAHQREQIEQDLSGGRSEIELNRRRRTEAQEGIDAARNEIDSLYAEQQKLTRDAEEIEESRRTLAQRLDEIRGELVSQRKAREAGTERVNTVRVELGEADVRIENLITRGSDEMGMDLVELYKGYQHDQTRDWDAVDSEIRELRGKIERLGNVNLDAITEQEELDKRKNFLAEQLRDIRSSQHQLDELIRRINKESRQLFIETFEAVRKNFQELFRKLFGGGRADILLTDPEDVLESGIEIVARPPGKELRSLSLLSGGEKTLTALALLFSIFRTRPSPFCLLDEVDAALDETNTERFSRLLHEFSDNSQFIIISHAKRTMSMASVLYGVTMQEPGVSKRISVRFEDAGQKLDEQLAPVGA